MFDSQQFGERIRELRIRQGLTQQDVGSQLGISAQAVSKWEKGLAAPDIALIPNLSQLFEVTTDVLFGMAEAEPYRGGGDEPNRRESSTITPGPVQAAEQNIPPVPDVIAVPAKLNGEQFCTDCQETYAANEIHCGICHDNYGADQKHCMSCHENYDRDQLHCQVCHDSYNIDEQHCIECHVNYDKDEQHCIECHVNYDKDEQHCLGCHQNYDTDELHCLRCHETYEVDEEHVCKNVFVHL